MSGTPTWRAACFDSGLLTQRSSMIGFAFPKFKWPLRQPLYSIDHTAATGSAYSRSHSLSFVQPGVAGRKDKLSQT